MLPAPLRLAGKGDGAILLRCAWQWERSKASTNAVDEDICDLVRAVQHALEFIDYSKLIVYIFYCQYGYKYITKINNLAFWAKK